MKRAAAGTVSKNGVEWNERGDFAMLIFGVSILVSE